MNIFQRVARAIRLFDGATTEKKQSSTEKALDFVKQGNVHEDAGRLAVAEKCYLAAIEAAPDLAAAHLNLGNAYMALGAPQKAISAYKKAASCDPTLAACHFNLGNAYSRLTRPETALECYRTATSMNPKFVQAWVAMGNSLSDMQRHDDAIRAYRQAIEIQPEFPEAYFNMGISQRLAGRVHDAVSCMREALKLRDDYVDAHIHLANYLGELLEFDDALANFQRAAELAPDSPHVHSSLLMHLSMQPNIDADELFDAHKQFGERFAPLDINTAKRFDHQQDRNRKLRVGFVSADFREHAVANFFLPILESLRNFDDLILFGYHNHSSTSQITTKISSLFSYWRAVDGMSDEALFDQIVADRIDILVDLSGHTNGNRLIVFGRKPAPIQVSWIGYPGTTGIGAIDYYIADSKFLPNPEFGDYFVEKLAYLPRSSPFMPYPHAPEPNPLPALSSGHFTFGSFNRPDKTNRQTIALWSRILKSRPNARMSLAGISDDNQQAVLTQWFASEGILSEMLVFHRRSDMDSYMRLHHAVDLCLDTHPYSGGTTTLHALWMGVPTLTLAGATPASRQSTALLTQLQMHDFVAGSPDDFVSLGIEWMDRTSDLAAVRKSLRGRMDQSPLCDTKLAASTLAQALRQMWFRWCDGQEATSFEACPPE